jgi:hypothetical protein
MLNVRQWNQFRTMQDALIVVSTKAGQNVIQGTNRKVRGIGVLKATRSNPHGCGTIRLVKPPKANPLVIAAAIVSAAKSLGNSMQFQNGQRPRPLTVTFHDCCMHRAARPAAE